MMTSWVPDQSPWEDRWKDLRRMKGYKWKKWAIVWCSTSSFCEHFSFAFEIVMFYLTTGYPISPASVYCSCPVIYRILQPRSSATSRSTIYSYARSLAFTSGRLNVWRTSATSSFGRSYAAKCPPLGCLLRKTTFPKVRTHLGSVTPSDQCMCVVTAKVLTCSARSPRP